MLIELACLAVIATFGAPVLVAVVFALLFLGVIILAIGSVVMPVMMCITYPQVSAPLVVLGILAAIWWSYVSSESFPGATESNRPTESISTVPTRTQSPSRGRRRSSRKR